MGGRCVTADEELDAMTDKQRTWRRGIGLIACVLVCAAIPVAVSREYSIWREPSFHGSVLIGVVLALVLAQGGLPRRVYTLLSVAMIALIFGFYESVERAQDRAAWARVSLTVSEACFQDGKLRANRPDICGELVKLSGKDEPILCTIGATPTAKCERRLRKLAAS